jgi:hypothetical protein
MQESLQKSLENIGSPRDETPRRDQPEPNEYTEVCEKLKAFKHFLTEKSDAPSPGPGRNSLPEPKSITFADPKRPAIASMNLHYLRQKGNNLTSIKDMHFSKISDLQSNPKKLYASIACQPIDPTE